MIDYSTDTGKVRLLIPDVELIEDPRHPELDGAYIFTDEQIGALLEIEGGNVKLAAAAAKLAIATSEALILKVLTTDDKATDGAKLAAELRQEAAQLRAEVKEAASSDGEFTLIEYEPVPRDWAWH